jgi:hypothetical protein
MAFSCWVSTFLTGACSGWTSKGRRYGNGNIGTAGTAEAKAMKEATRKRRYIFVFSPVLDRRCTGELRADSGASQHLRYIIISVLSPAKSTSYGFWCISSLLSIAVSDILCKGWFPSNISHEHPLFVNPIVPRSSLCATHLTIPWKPTICTGNILLSAKIQIWQHAHVMHTAGVILHHDKRNPPMPSHSIPILATPCLYPKTSALQTYFDGGRSYDVLPSWYWLNMKEHVAFREFLCVFEQVDLGDAQVSKSRLVLNQEVAEGDGVRSACRALMMSSR